MELEERNIENHMEVEGRLFGGKNEPWVGEGEGIRWGEVMSVIQVLLQNLLFYVIDTC